jgi:sulfur relay (sulfurtransferase) DsrC/TusE family protein
MDLSEYRRELKEYFAAVEKCRLERHRGAETTVRAAEIEERFGDLFSRTAVGDLEQMFAAAAADELTETERRARRNLLNIARLRFLKNQTRQIEGEFDSCRRAARVSFRNEKLTVPQATAEIAAQENSDLRRELYARVTEAVNSCADLWLEKFKVRRAAAAKIGFENYQSLFEEIASVEFENLARNAENFLAATEESYFRLRAEVFSEAKFLHPADFYFRRNQLERAEIFAGKNLSLFYARLLENFGFRAEKIPQIKLAADAPVEKTTDSFRPNFPSPPVVLAVSARNGNSAFAEFLKVFGRTQQAAWTSLDLSARFPEFVFSPDAVLGGAYSVLFQSLLTEENFLRRSFGLWNEKLTEKIARENRFWILCEIRRNVLQTLFEIKVQSSDSPVETAREFADACAQNLGFATSESEVLYRLSEDFAPAKNLRAALFGYGLREYLRGRHDFDWWNTAAAFEELIDFWNTSERHQAEEMARMIGFEMDFETLKGA